MPHLTAIDPEPANASVLEYLNHLTERALLGELSSIAVAFVLRDGSTGSGFSSVPSLPAGVCIFCKHAKLNSPESMNPPNRYPATRRVHTVQSSPTKKHFGPACYSEDTVPEALDEVKALRANYRRWAADFEGKDAARQQANQHRANALDETNLNQFLGNILDNRVCKRYKRLPALVGGVAALQAKLIAEMTDVI